MHCWPLRASETLKIEAPDKNGSDWPGGMSQDVPNKIVLCKSYVQNYECLVCRFMYVLCALQSKQARCASPSALRSLASVPVYIYIYIYTLYKYKTTIVQNSIKHINAIGLAAAAASPPPPPTLLYVGV